MRINAAVGVVVGLAVVLAACSTTVVGNPAPATGSGPASSTGGPDGVPKVAHPLETSRFEKEPCATLSSEQLGQLGITTAPKPMPEDKLGPSCTWNADDDGGLNLGARLLTVGSSLASLYKQRDQGRWKLFEPVADVAGYPGVLLDPSSAQPKGKCELSVAVRDDLIYSLQVDMLQSSKDYANPCPVVQKAAEMAVSTMKGA
jgi:hypothetical protein